MLELLRGRVEAVFLHVRGFEDWTCVCVCVSLSHVQLFSTSLTIAHQAPLSMDFPGKNIGVGCHSLLQGISLTQGLNLGLRPGRGLDNSLRLC